MTALAPSLPNLVVGRPVRPGRPARLAAYRQDGFAGHVGHGPRRKATSSDDGGL